MLYAAEYVLPGHPDKLCDAIADALVEEAVRHEKRALCAIEVAVHRASVFVTGRIACRGARRIPVKDIVRECYRVAGYRTEWRPSPEELDVRTNLCLGPLVEGEAGFREVADDQSIITGYAIDSPGTNFLPPEHWLASRLARRLETLRTGRPDLRLGPDGKLALVFDAGSKALACLTASVQQTVVGDEIELNRAVRQCVAEELASSVAAISGLQAEIPESFHVNGAGNFEVGGPEGDNGLSGKKLVVDGYGPRVPIGGGALSGKDFFKADRAGAILARRLAKAVVMSGAAPECTATITIAPGERAFRIVSLVGCGAALDPRRWTGLMDLSLMKAGENYAGMTGLPDLARYGHFTLPDRPWERIEF
uniref:Methionine adenosyltransferase n=1 Tax=Solibacter usitatus (strain Ellin6076) TaxID=234267 RepID=Q027Y1_SOLUE